jgi:EmrB/QacA subfamily drug resistance transporter
MSSTFVDYSRKWYVMAAVAMGIFLATIDSSIVNVALPTLVKEFGATFAIVGWVVLAYLLTLTSLLLSVGRVADMVGKKPIYLLGFIIFTSGSLLCGISPGIIWLIAFRILQAIGATMILALGMAIVTEAFPREERGRALGITGAVVSIGIIIGPTIGGLILSALSWHWIFLVNLPIGLLGIWMVIRFVPFTQPPGGQRFDILGAGLLLIGLLSILFALTLGQQHGFQELSVIILLLLGSGVLGLFIYVEKHTGQPMIDLRVFSNHQFSINLATGFLSFVAISGATLLMPFYLENVLAYNTRMVGLLMAVVPIATGIVAPFSGNLSDRFGSRPITVIGLLTLTIGYYVLSKLSLSTTAASFLLLFLPVGLGMGIFQSPNNSAIMGTASRDRLGVISGILAVTRTLGQTAGIAVVGAVWASQVLSMTNNSQPTTATYAPAIFQVTAVQNVFFGLAILMLLALSLSLVGVYLQKSSEGRTTNRLSTISDIVNNPDDHP